MAALLLLLTGAVSAAADPLGTATVGTATVGTGGTGVATTTTITCPGQVVYANVPYNPCSAKTTIAGGTVVGSPAVVYPADVTNAGTVYVSAAYHDPNGSYADSSATGSFVIEKAFGNVSISCPQVVAYTGKPLEPCHATVLTLNAGEYATTKQTYSSNTGPGEATFTAYFAGNPNVGAGGGSTTFQIGNPTTTTLSCNSATYTGSPITSSCTSTVMGDGGFTATPTLTFSNNTNAGTARVTATFAGDGAGGHLASVKTATFTIAKAPSEVTVTCPTSVTFTGAPLTPCTATTTGVGTLTGTTSTAYTDNTNVGQASVTASYPGDANHLPANATGTFAITPAPVVVTVTCPSSADFTGTPLTPCTATVAGPGGLATTTPVTYTGNTYPGTATATATYPAGGNYLSGTATATFRVIGFTLKGYYRPVDMSTANTTAWNIVRAGSTVPLKFEAFLPNGTEITSSAVLGATFTTTKVACPTAAAAATAATVNQASTDATGLRYDTTSGQFIQHWKTPKGAPGCYRATTTTADQSQLTAYFILR